MTNFQGDRCETCRFWMPDDVGPNGLCRRNPPAVIAWVDPHAKDRKNNVAIRAQFPIMLPSGWCGEHGTIG